MPKPVRHSVQPVKPRSRGAVNEVVEGKVYQRGQILTWQREKKYAMLQEYGIKTVVNFWPKIDPDLSESSIDAYIFLPAVRSEMMLEPRMEEAARWVAEATERGPALILCEAGMTRSVYFCVLLVSIIEGISLPEAKRLVSDRLGRVSFKKFMDERLKHG